MDCIGLFTGLFIIIGAIILRIFPRSISFYSFASKTRKENIDFEGLSTYAFKILIIIAIATISGYYVCQLLKLAFLADIFLILPLLVGITILTFHAKKFDHNDPPISIRIPSWLIGLIFIIILLSWGMWPTNIQITTKAIQFSGMYGCTIPVSQIQSINLADQIPNILIRSNGFSFSGYNKGFFKLKEWGKCRLFIRRNNDSPYLIIEEKNGMRTIFNVSDTTLARKYFQDISALVTNNPTQVN